MSITKGSIVFNTETKSVGVVCDETYISWTRFISSVWEDGATTKGEGCDWSADSKYELIEEGDWKESDLSTIKLQVLLNHIKSKINIKNVADVFIPQDCCKCFYNGVYGIFKRCESCKDFSEYKLSEDYKKIFNKLWTTKNIHT